MGNQNNKSVVVQIPDIQSHLSQCKQIDTINCPIYGQLYLVQYSDMEFYLGQSKNNAVPHIKSLHWLLKPNLIVVPKFTLLEQIKIRSLQDLLDIIVGVSQAASESSTEIGIGHNRIAYAQKWGVVGQKSGNWLYQQILNNQQQQQSKIYLSPEQMVNLSQGRLNPRYDAQKSDVFCFGIILLQMLFGSSLAEIYDYNKFQIRLKPLLQKLNYIKQQPQQQILYTILLRMLELDQNNRADFSQIIQIVNNYRNRSSKMMNSYMLSSTNSQQQTKRMMGYKNGVSPLRGGFNRNEARITQRLGGRTPQRTRIISNQQYQQRSPIRLQQIRQNKSPLRRDLRINTKIDKQNIGFFNNNITNNKAGTTKANSNINFNNMNTFQGKGRIQGLSPISRR